jgi:hypothetical protein
MLDDTFKPTILKQIVRDVIHPNVVSEITMDEISQTLISNKCIPGSVENELKESIRQHVATSKQQQSLHES